VGISSWQKAFLESERLQAAYLETARQFFDPLARRLALLRRERGRAILVGLNGSQGSGKSTLCAYLCAALGETQGLRAIDLSLDDFYLTRHEREVLAREVHPLLRTRGVPGTHDARLLVATLDALQAKGGEAVSIPRFDKAEDDRFPSSAWSSVELPVDIVLLEGWCMGAGAVDDQALATPINALERDEDPDGVWRTYVNERLRWDFEPLYARVDLWVMLAAPNFEQVLAWRTEQEEKLRVRRGADGAGGIAGESGDSGKGRGGGTGLMDDAQLRRFVAHFERLTRQCLESMPEQVDVLLQLDSSRNIVSARGLES
jgi:D-glycerate 3-kinase